MHVKSQSLHATASDLSSKVLDLCHTIPEISQSPGRIYKLDPLYRPIITPISSL